VYEWDRRDALAFDAGHDDATGISFSFVDARVNIAGRRYCAISVKGTDVARPRGTTVEKARVVLETTDEPALPISSEPDARLVALVRLLARQAAREFVEGVWDHEKQDRLPD
jgi:hypothetical protein